MSAIDVSKLKTILCLMKAFNLSGLKLDKKKKNFNRKVLAKTCRQLNLLKYTKKILHAMQIKAFVFIFFLFFFFHFFIYDTIYKFRLGHCFERIFC